MEFDSIEDIKTYFTERDLLDCKIVVIENVATGKLRVVCVD